MLGSRLDLYQLNNTVSIRPGKGNYRFLIIIRNGWKSLNIKSKKKRISRQNKKGKDKNICKKSSRKEEKELSK
jgi:hypothetical protein